MGRLVRSANLIRASVEHAERVFSGCGGRGAAVDAEDLSDSWRRSANDHGVDPADDKAPRILTAGELKDSREPLGKLILGAREEIDRLYKMVREAGYTILFCDSAGVAVEHRGEDAESEPIRILGNLARRRLVRRDRGHERHWHLHRPRSGLSPFTGASTSDRDI